MRLFLLLLCVVLSGLNAPGAAALLAAADAPRAPALAAPDPARWFNSPPLELEALRGRVLLVDFWTFGCWNCYRSIPWLKALEARFDPGQFQIVGVHSPEFEHEKVRARVGRKIRDFDVRHPVVMDNELRIWRAWQNRYWPAFYLVDRHGRVRDQFVGETHVGDAQARAVEQAIETLLAEP